MASLRPALLTLHRWAGVVSAAFLAAIALSGSVLVFESEIDRALNPQLSYVTPAAHRQSFETLLTRVRATYPREQVLGIRIGETADQADEFSLRGGISVMIDPYTGLVLGARDREHSFARWMHLLHTRFVAGQIGERVVGVFSVVLLGLALSGVVLWWPRKILRVERGASWRRVNFDLHNTLGFYASLVIAVMAATGILIAFESITDPMVRSLNRAPEPPAPQQSTPISGATPMTLDEVVSIAGNALPGAFVSNVNVPATPRAVYRVLMKFPEDRTPAGRSRVYVDQYSGAVLLVENTRTAPLGTRILNLKRSLHTGDIFGAPTRALYFVVSLVVAMQAITGVLIWRNGRARTGHDATPQPRSRRRVPRR